MAIELIEPLAAPLNEFFVSTVMFFPNLIGAIILVAIGWVIGSIVGRVIKELMIRFKVDQYVTKKGPMLKFSEIFPIVFEWVIYLVFIQAAVDILQIEAISTFVEMIIAYIPGVVGAVVVVIVGYIFAEYIRSEIRKAKIAYSGVMSNVLFWLIIYVAFALALPLVGIDSKLVDNILLITVGAFGVGLAIALGLGLKNVITEIAREEIRKASQRKV